MRISVRALPVDDVIQDISIQWKVPLVKENEELSLQFPNHLGEGFIRCTNFHSGVGVIEYHGTFIKDYDFLFTLNKTHPLKFIFCAQGEADHAFEEDEDRHTIDTFQNVIVSSSRNNGHVLGFKKNIKTHITSIEIVRKQFCKYKNNNFDGLDPTLKSVFEDSVAQKKFFYLGNYSMKAAAVVEEINSKRNKGFLRSIFLEGKLNEMLAIQINQYLDDQREDKKPQILRQMDIENAIKTTRLIKQQLDTNFSVDFLAKEVGTNVNKLQESFKYLYDLTVNKYMQKVKLEAAKEMLVTSDYNISQVVNLIGLNNRSYFSKIFKEKYGVSPKYFLSTAKNLHQDKNPEE